MTNHLWDGGTGRQFQGGGLGPLTEERDSLAVSMKVCPYSLLPGSATSWQGDPGPVTSPLRPQFPHMQKQGSSTRCFPRLLPAVPVGP